jgi:hypothetical protein
MYCNLLKPRVGNCSYSHRMIELQREIYVNVDSVDVDSVLDTVD